MLEYLLGSESHGHRLGRYASHDCVWRHVSDHHRPGCHDRPPSDINTVEDDRTVPDPYVAAHSDAPRVSSRSIPYCGSDDVVTVIVSSDEADTRCDKDAVADLDVRLDDAFGPELHSLSEDDPSMRRPQNHAPRNPYHSTAHHPALQNSETNKGSQ